MRNVKFTREHLNFLNLNKIFWNSNREQKKRSQVQYTVGLKHTLYNLSFEMTNKKFKKVIDVNDLIFEKKDDVVTKTTAFSRDHQLPADLI